MAALAAEVSLLLVIFSSDEPMRLFSHFFAHFYALLAHFYKNPSILCINKVADASSVVGELACLGTEKECSLELVAFS